MKRALIISLLLAACSANAAEKYYRQGASGSGSGNNWTDAYTSWATAYGAVARGDTLWVADTSSSIGNITLDKAASGTTTLTIKKATVSSHGTETGWDNSYGDGQAVFGSITAAGVYHVMDGQTRTETTRMEAPAGYGFRATAISSDDLFGGAGEDASFSTFRYMQVGGTWSTASTPAGTEPDHALRFVYTQTGLTFERCIFHNAGICNGAIAKMHGTIDATFDHCDFYMGWGKATIAAPNNGITGLTVKYCRFWNGSRLDPSECTEGEGITTEIGSYSTGMGSTHSDNIVYGSVFYGTASGGRNAVIQWGDGSPTGGEGSGCLVYNCTFAGFPESSVIGDIFLYSGSGNIARNNLFYDTGSASVTANTTSHTVDAGSDPFVDYANLDFRLAAATSAGTSLGSPYDTDPSGATRGSDGTFDVGAYEFIATEPVYVLPVAAHNSRRR